MKKSRNDDIREYMISASVGILAARGLPMAAVSAGWELSASLGSVKGDSFALVVFILGSSSIALSGEIFDSKAKIWLKAAIGIVYSISAGCLCYNAVKFNSFSAMRIVFSLIDSVLVTYSLLADQLDAHNCLLAVLPLMVWTVTFLTSDRTQIYSVFIPLAASFLCGAAASSVCTADKLRLRWLLTGAASVMALNIKL